MARDLKFVPKLNSNLAASQVSQDVKIGDSIGIQGTPTFFLCNTSGEVWELQNILQVEDRMSRQR